jgi:S-(hydroxymethyl)glutathione dehydrogenase/alcohol dehydrogenase
MGGVKGRTDLPKLVDWVTDGPLNISDMITHKLPLERINEGYELMKRGVGLRSVVVF